MTHRIIDIVTGVRPQELVFPTKQDAERWLAAYGVSQSYKEQHYRIVPA